MCNIKHKTQLTHKGFTLIELLIVIAIIGILASVILVSLSSGRTKAKDAAIMAAAHTIMAAAQIDAVGSQDYSAYYMSTYPNWLASWNNQCATNFAGAANPVSMRSACDGIVKNGGVLWIYSHSATSGGPKLSILIVLPGGGFYCIGSNGAASKTSTAYANNAANNTLPGCPDNLTVNGE